MMIRTFSFVGFLAVATSLPVARGAEIEHDIGLQMAGNSPMIVQTTHPPAPPEPTEDFDTKAGYRLVTSLDDFRKAIKMDNQRVRMKPGIYRADSFDPPIKRPLKQSPGIGRNRKEGRQEQIFAVTGSHNIFDLRGVVIETPVSVQNKLSRRPHVADCWNVSGTKNTFIGGYFRNVIDMEYPKYGVCDNEFEIQGDGNRFFDCTFVVKGSFPYGYSDYFGKGAGAFVRLNKHSFMSIDHANDTELIRCKVYQQSFGHCVHLHTVDGMMIKDCFFTGTIRPTNDIYKEKEGTAVDKDFNILFRGKRPIPRDEVIPLTEDGIRSYDNVKNITIMNTTVERMRGAIQLLLTGDVVLENVTVREPGDFSFDVSAVEGSRIVMKNCRSDIAYNPVFNLTRGDLPTDARYELTILNAPEGTRHTARSSLGTIVGKDCSFIFRDGTTRPLDEEVNYLICGGKKPLTGSTVDNYTNAKLILEENVKDCVIRSAGPVEDKGRGNRVEKIPLK